jgi:hypothetical protein
MTVRESKAISDRINRKSEQSQLLGYPVEFFDLTQLVALEKSTRDTAKKMQSNADYYRKEIKRRKMEAKKLTGSGDDRRITNASPKQSEASPAVDGLRPDGGDGHRRTGDRA